LDILKPKLEKFIKSGGEVYSYKHSVKEIEGEERIPLINRKPLYIYKE
jgi:hypothetical protein